MYSDDFVIDNLRDSVKESNDGYDFPLTGYEHNDVVINELGSFSYITPSSDLDIDDATFGNLFDEAHREYADYRSPEGVSVSRRLLSSIEQGNLWETEMSISQLVLVSRETRTVLIWKHPSWESGR